MLGPAGTYSHLAAEIYFGAMQECFEQSIPSVFDAVAKEKAAFGVVPFENNTNGTVGQTLDFLVQHNGTLHIVGEVFIPVRHCLAGIADMPDSLTTISSHPQAIEQCAGYLARMYPKAYLLEAPSTAGAMQALALTRNPHHAAIGPEFTAKRYGLSIIASDIQDKDDNYTVFFVIGRDASAQKGADRTMICIDLSSRRDHPGTLRELLSIIEEEGVNLSYIQSRPTGVARNAYRFFFTFDGSIENPSVQNALSRIGKTAHIGILGSYAAAQAK